MQSYGMCERCPVGTMCDVPGITRETLPLMPDYWRVSPQSIKISECDVRGACVGTNLSSWLEEVWLTGWNASEAEYAAGLCAEGFVGPYCRYCAPGWYEAYRGGCSLCTPRTRSLRTLLTFLGVLVFLIVLIGINFRKVRDGVMKRVNSIRLRLADDGSGKFSADQTRVFDVPTAVQRRLLPIVSVKLQLCLTYLQILTLIQGVFDVNFPRNYDSFLQRFKFVNIDGFNIPVFQCLVIDDYYSGFVGFTALPIVCFCILGLVMLGARVYYRHEPRKYRGVIDTCFHIFILSSYVVFVSESTKVLQYFTCHELDDGVSYLFVDMRIRCDSERHRAYLPYVIFCLIVYPLGTTLLYAYLLVVNRDRIHRPTLDPSLAIRLRRKDPQLQKILFLFSPYEPRCWWVDTESDSGKLLP
jgi:hypothetical protein